MHITKEALDAAIRMAVELGMLPKDESAQMKNRQDIGRVLVAAQMAGTQKLVNMLDEQAQRAKIKQENEALVAKLRAEKANP
jgi:hypothetical protein